MPVNVQWDDAERTTLSYGFSGAWTWSELLIAFQHGCAMSAAVRGRVGSIFDLRATDHFPENAFIHLQHLAEIQAPNAGLTIVVTHSRYARAIFRHAMRLDEYVAHTFRLAARLDDAQVTLLVDRVVA